MQKNSISVQFNGPINGYLRYILNGNKNKVRRATRTHLFGFGTENLETVSQHPTSLDGINYLLYFSINNFFYKYNRIAQQTASRLCAFPLFRCKFTNNNPNKQNILY